MIGVTNLIEIVRRYNSRVDIDRVRRAYDYGKKAHKGQFRKSGEAYFNHPIAVAEILTELRLDDATIITALLHDTIEDTNSSFKEIKLQFGDQIEA